MNVINVFFCGRRMKNKMFKISENERHERHAPPNSIAQRPSSPPTFPPAALLIRFSQPKSLDAHSTAPSPCFGITPGTHLTPPRSFCRLIPTSILFHAKLTLTSAKFSYQKPPHVIVRVFSHSVFLTPVTF